MRSHVRVVPDAITFLIERKAFFSCFYFILFLLDVVLELGFVDI